MPMSEWLRGEDLALRGEKLFPHEHSLPMI